MDSRFFRFVWRYSKRDQLIILALTFLSFPLVYLSLEVPKVIINEAISGTGFPLQIMGFAIDQVPYLLALCGLYLALIIAINAIKWAMNVQIGMTGERMLRRLRYMLFERVLRFRITRFRSTKPGEVIQSIIGEIEPLGGFIGEVIATPAFQGGLLVVYMTFIFVQDWVLGLAAIALYPIQAYLIPILQRKIVRLNKERAANTRVLADTVGEAVTVIGDVHTNNTARWHQAQIAGRLYTNTRIRLQLFRRKFTIKMVNNIINHLTPFFFYSIGGYLVIKEQLDFGSLVAVLAAYKDVAAPWKAVLTYVQRWADFNSRYVFVVENFSGDDVLPEERLYPKEWTALSGPLVYQSVEGGPGTGGLTVPDIRIEPGQMVAVLGGESGAREAFLTMAAGLSAPLRGQVLIGDRPIIDANLPQLGASVAYIGAEPGIVQCSIRENLLYGLFRGRPDLSDQTTADWAEMLAEAKMTGNTTADPDGDWVDLGASGAADRAALDATLLDLVETVGLSDELYSSALTGRLNAARTQGWNDAIMDARRRLHEVHEDLDDLVEAWTPDAFNGNGSLLENVLYGSPVEDAPASGDDAQDAKTLAAIEACGAKPVLIEIGRDIAREFSELVEALEPTSSVLDSFAGYVRADILAAHELVIAEATSAKAQKAEHDALLLRLAFAYVDVRDGLDVMTEERMGTLLACRTKARAALAKDPHFVLYDQERFNPARSVSGNIVHGKRRFDRRTAWKTLDGWVREAVETVGLQDDLIRLGLDQPVAGSGLSLASRRKIGLVRGLIKQPNLVVLDGAASADSPEDAALREAIRAAVPNAIVLFAAQEEAAAAPADQIVTIDRTGSANCTLSPVPAQRNGATGDTLTDGGRDEP